MNGDFACAEGAISAGCRFFAGYPITPATEVAERMASRLPEVDGVFIQMEDELASMNAILGASWAGVKAMTATSGPGFSLMMENLGLGIMLETPCVVANIQRAGPSTGLPTLAGQGDMMQARWGAHGDYQIIAVSPWSVQEAYTETIRAFNLAERFRLPVIVLTEEAVGHLRENVDVRAETRIYNRLRPKDKEPPFGQADVPPMPVFGQGHKLLVTGSTHDEWGYRRTSSAEAQETLVTRLSTKVTNHLDEIIEVEERFCDEDELDILVVAFGFTARSAWRAVKAARQEGKRAGLLRLKTIWPFPEEAVRQLALRSRAVLVPEMNRGQILREVQRVAPQAQGYNKTDGEVIVPAEIWQAMRHYCTTGRR